MTFEEAAAFALTLPDTVRTTSYGQPAIGVASNGRAFLNAGHERDTSFVLALDPGEIDLLMATDPATFWQTPHYAGYAAVLVRYDGGDAERVRRVIERSRDWTAARKPVHPRRKA